MAAPEDKSPGKLWNGALNAQQSLVTWTGTGPLSWPPTTPSTAPRTGRSRAIVTGGSSGIGVETARALAAAGAEVTLAVRNTAAGDAVAEGIEESTGGTRPRVVRLDLADRRTVTRFVDAWNGPLHLLINNAGVVTSGLERTGEGWELQFATNHLGHFTLATGLHDALAAGASERDGARIVSVSSTAHMRAGAGGRRRPGCYRRPQRAVSAAGRSRCRDRKRAEA
ncbi:NAD(P)-dependent dehydrogenase (short-subunit alcohol dehydrogenase family) [Streptomyces aurantiacus]|nr:NAD(P)-dependent dehydrogenase (short-subunit alcohol dehydrogenase family) [Streptomyces aurantiacus]